VTLIGRGDPIVFGEYWKKMSETCTVVIKGWELMSYLSDMNNVCWYMLPETKEAIKRLHHVVGNAVTEDRYIVVGNGATQLLQGAVFALTPSEASKPINVVVAAPYYSVIIPFCSPYSHIYNLLISVSYVFFISLQ